MPLFIIVIISYAVFFYLAWRAKKSGAWVYIGAIVGVPIFIVIVAYALGSMGLFMDLGDDPGGCVKWHWATGECSKTKLP